MKNTNYSESFKVWKNSSKDEMLGMNANFRNIAKSFKSKDRHFQIMCTQDHLTEEFFVWANIEKYLPERFLNCDGTLVFCKVKKLYFETQAAADKYVSELSEADKLAYINTSVVLRKIEDVQVEMWAVAYKSPCSRFNPEEFYRLFKSAKKQEEKQKKEVLTSEQKAKRLAKLEAEIAKLKA